MAAVPIEDEGVGSAVNDVSRELGSALGVAIIGSIVSHLYRSNVQENLNGQVPARVVDIASEGIGVIHVAAQSIDPAAAGEGHRRRQHGIHRRDDNRVLGLGWIHRHRIGYLVAHAAQAGPRRAGGPRRG